MAGRPNKAGLDYFELDCHMEEKIRLIQAEFGLKGFAVIVKLYQKIYGEFGYYCEWTEDSLLLFMSENGVSSRDEKNLITEIVKACIRRDIFSKELFDKYSILTSSGVQKRYFNAASKRERVEVKKEYLLISVPKNSINVVINSISDGRNSISSTGNTQSKVKESKEEKSKVENINADKPHKDYYAMIEEKCFPYELKETVKQWLTYKIEKRQTYKEMGFASLLTQIEKKANEFGPAAVINLIEESMACNWQGIIWRNLKKYNSNKNNEINNRFAEVDSW